MTFISQVRNAGILCSRDEKILLGITPASKEQVQLLQRSLQEEMEAGHAFQDRCERNHP